MNTPMMLGLALLAYLFTKKKPAAAQLPPAGNVRPPMTPAPSKTPGKVTLPEILVTAPVPAVPLTTTQPVSAKSVPWPATEQKFQAPAKSTSSSPEPAAARRVYTPMVIRESGTAVPQDESAAMQARERAPFDSSYWMSSTKLSPAEVQEANAILKFNWTKGGVSFRGPRTFAGRRQYRAVEQGGRKAVTVWQAKPPFR